MTGVSAFCVLWGAAALFTVTGFSVLPRSIQPCHNVLSKPCFQKVQNRGGRPFQLSPAQTTSLDDYTDEEIQDMRQMILSLSLEGTDESRRSRLENVFSEFFQRTNGMPDRFATLFDRLVIKIGDEVQTEAKKRFYEAQAATATIEQEGDKISSDGDNELADDGKREKLPDELQLWALVDMMVQAKTLAKKAKTKSVGQDAFE
jgi:hypothetical protein